MSNSHRPRCPLAVLLRDGEAIISAGETHTELAPRLPDGCLTTARSLLTQAGAGITGQKGKRAEVGTLTQAQNAQLQTLQTWMSRARKTARTAFPGQDVKLHQEFQVGVNEPHDLASVEKRAGIILAGLKKAENLPALKGRGWLDADTTAYEAALSALGATDATQETAKGGAKDATTERDRAAADLYDHLLTLQNAADLQWPAENPANAGVRDEFRLKTFPPRAAGGEAAPPTPPAPPPAPPPAT